MTSKEKIINVAGNSGGISGVSETGALEYESAVQQHEHVDKLRVVEFDVGTISQQTEALFQLRRDDPSITEKEFTENGSVIAPDVLKSSPFLFKSIGSETFSGLDNMQSICKSMMEKADLVKKGLMTHTEMRNKIFEKELVEDYGYYKRK